MLNVVLLNGGRGAAAVIPALLARQGLHVTSVVNAYDDGKSTGEIRRFFGMLGPSDIRKVQELMLPEDDSDHQANLRVFQYRFPVDCAYDEVLTDLHAFADGKRTDLVGASFASAKVRSALKTFVREFLAGLHTIEQVNGERFSFSRLLDHELHLRRRIPGFQSEYRAGDAVHRQTVQAAGYRAPDQY